MSSKGFCRFLYNQFVLEQAHLGGLLSAGRAPWTTESSFAGFIPADIIEHLKAAVTVFGEAQGLEGSASPYAEMRDPE